ALRVAQPRGPLHDEPEVGEPGRQAVGPEAVGPEDVRDEADALAAGAEEPLQLLGQLGLVGHGEPGDALGGGAHLAEPSRADPGTFAPCVHWSAPRARAPPSPAPRRPRTSTCASG